MPSTLTGLLLHNLWADALRKIQFKLIVFQFLIHGQLGDGDEKMKNMQRNTVRDAIEANRGWTDLAIRQ